MIEIQNLEKSFGSKRVLDKLSFSIGQNTIYGLLGPNGAGKTTTINIMCNLLDADAGTITMQGSSEKNMRKQLIGVVPQEISVYRDLSCKENLMFFAKIYGLEGSDRTRRINSIIDMLNLSEYENTSISKLSGGWQRRVNIAVALVNSPVLLIMDEPTAGLDVEARHELWELINSFKDSGVSVLLTTHQLEEAERLCSQIGILQNGRIIAEGTLAELRKLVPAKKLAIIETDNVAALQKRVTSIDWEYRPYGGRIILYMPEEYALSQVVNMFDGIPLTSISLQEIGLEHVYLEVIPKTIPSTP